jgi:ADP-heptose:LPS heptosyltransferase
MNSKKVNKILVLRFSSIGDIVLTTPVLRIIKTQMPHVELHYCTKKSYHSLLASNPHIDKIYTLDKELAPLVATLKTEKYDFVVDLHNSLRTRLIKLQLGVKSKAFDKLNTRKWIFTNFKKNVMPNVHIVDRYVDTLKPLGLKNDEEGLEYFIPHKDEIEKDWLPETHREYYIVYAIGGQHATKKLPLKKMIQLCDQINKPIVLIGGKEDVETGEQIADFFNQQSDEIIEKLNKKAVIFNACGKFNINQSAAIIRDAKVVFTHDTGMMHIAAAFKKKIYSIWGNTSPHFGMYPYKTEFVIYENNKLKCRPCSKIGFKACPKGHFKCMNDLQFDFWIA